MKDAQGLAQGRTRWRRFAAVVIPAAAAAGAIVFGMANGAIAAQLSVSGQTFKVKADSLVGSDFTQYGGTALTTKSDGSHVAQPVAYSNIGSAHLKNLCQSVRAPGLPVSLVIEAGNSNELDKQVQATNLQIAMTDLTGDVTFDNIQIGVDAGGFTDANGNKLGNTPGSFGQKSQQVTINNLQQTAYSTTAGKFTLPGLHLYVDVKPSPKECF